MRSMTGFGQAAGETERFRISVTLRGVNHRFLDLGLRLREDLRWFEPALRDCLKQRLWRGRVEVSLDVAGIGERDVQVSIDENVASAVKAMCDDLRERGIARGELSLAELLRLPEVVNLQIRDPEWDDEDRMKLLSLVDEALDQLIAARITEGEKLTEALLERLDGLLALTDELSRASEGQAAALAKSLQRRIRELTEEIDESRLAQEVALLVDRSDVSEEIDRLRSHLDHFRKVMQQDGSIGKRLDFLTQEVLRELNTLGAKCRDSKMTRQVLDGKVLCEQLREQVQNIE